MAFIDVKHTETGGITQIPDEPGVLSAYEARGWELYEPEPEAPYVPPKGMNDPDGEPILFVTLYQEGVGTAQFPNNSAALEEAANNGWTVPPFEDPAKVPDESEPPKPKPATAKRKTTPAADSATDEGN
jgi:hypothetical protein